MTYSISILFILINSNVFQINLDPVEPGYAEPTSSEDAYKRLKISLQRFQKSSADENGNQLLSQKELDAHAANVFNLESVFSSKTL